jgi:ubiquinone/menaquinone biosynthesis C-methylase UbiE
MNIYLKLISDQINSLISGYNNASPWAKTFILTLLLLLFIAYMRNAGGPTDGPNLMEGFEQQGKFVFKQGPAVYDDFYASIYDFLVYNHQKDQYEIGEIINKTTPTTQSRILDVGCGNGHHVGLLTSQKMDVTGMDISPDMVEHAKKAYPDGKFIVGDALKSTSFEPNSFTHITCLYFTIYYFQNKDQFFENAFRWLMPGGSLIVHLVNREKFDPILPPGNPLLFVSPQKYAKQRITHTNLVFDTFDYSANFDLNKSANVAKFTERFKFKDGKSRKNEHIMYMEPQTAILTRAQEAGFILQNKMELMNCAYDFQYLYVLIKPT